jgi:hypothetical protein
MTHPRPHTAPELTASGARWIKSSYSDGAGNNCVEIADLTATSYGGMAVRDSKRPESGALLFSIQSFNAFLHFLPAPPRTGLNG